jgi:hypothetical protein
VTVGPNEKADATITGESPHQTLNLKIPRGRKGEKGERGDDGQPGGGGGTVVIDGGGGIPEAPADGQQYARQNASWTVVTGDGSGAPGPPGVRGSLWFTGAGPPTDGTGMLTGDMYLDETTGDVYRWL